MDNTARIKRNIGKMIEQNVPETDIDAYVASEGMTPAMLRGEPNAAPVRAPQPMLPVDENSMNFGTSADVQPPTMPYGEQMANVGRYVGQSADDFVRRAANMATFGTADKLAAGANSAISGGSYDDALKAERAQSAAALDRSPVSSRAGDVAGVLTGAGALIKNGITLAPKLADAPLLLKMAGFGAEGAAYGAANAAGNTDSGDLNSRLRTALYGGMEGAAIGAGVPLAGRALQGLYQVGAPFVQGGVNGMSRFSSGLIENAMTPNVSGKLAELGPNAMLPDTSRGLRNLAQATAAKSGEGAEALTSSLTARELGTRGRVNSDVVSNVGPTGVGIDGFSAIKPADALVADIVQQRKDVTGPMFRDVFKNATAPIDTNGTLTALGQRMTEAGNGTAAHAALNKIRGMLLRETQEGVPVAVTDPRQLHSVKTEIQRMIKEGDPTLGIQPGSEALRNGALKTVAKSLNADLRKQVPGYAEANDVSRRFAQNAEAAQYGNEALGKSGPSVDMILREQAGMNEGQRNLSKAGAAAAVQETIDNAANARVGLKQALQGGNGSANDRKIGAFLGEDTAKDLGNTLRRETVFDETTNRVLRGSNTGSTAGGAKQIEPDGLRVFDLARHPIRALTDALLGVAAKSSGDVTRAQLGKVLSLQGPERDALMKAFLDRQDGRSAALSALGSMVAPQTTAALIAARRGTEQPSR